MCFPSKRQKDVLSDTTKNPTEPSKDTTTTTQSPTTVTATDPSATASSSIPAPKPSQPTTSATSTKEAKMAPKLAIVIYSMYGHVAKMAEAIKKGIETAGGTVTIFQIPETLSEEVLTAMHAPPKPPYPIITPAELAGFDGFLCGIPTRFGSFPAQWKTFWDSTGQQWMHGSFARKYAGVFVSTASPGGGQESTVLATITTFAHHGIIYVPLGYAGAFQQMTGVEELHGGGPLGSGTFASSQGARQPTPLELEVAEIQGKSFYEILSRVSF